MNIAFYTANNELLMSKQMNNKTDKAEMIYRSVGRSVYQYRGYLIVRRPRSRYFIEPFQRGAIKPLFPLQSTLGKAKRIINILKEGANNE